MSTIDYQKQGTDFLASCGASMTAAFLRTEQDDEARLMRGVYRIEISRGGRPWAFEFTQCAARSRSFKTDAQKKREHYSWEEQRKVAREVKEQVQPPTAYDVLACLTKSNPGTFEDFCGDYGYDEDSRKAEATYRAVVAEWLQVSAMFSPEEIERMREIN